MKNIVGVILAAGRSTRMKSRLPKALHPVCGRPMLEYVLGALSALGIKRIYVVLGFKKELVRGILDGGIKVVEQKRLLGTAHALGQTKVLLKNYQGDILVVYADHPLLRKKTLNRVINHHRKTGADCTLLTASLSNPEGYGRIIRDSNHRIIKIIEEIDAGSKELKIKEVNPGVWCFKANSLFRALSKIKLNKKKGEYYLTDILHIFYSKGKKVEDVPSAHPEEEGLGVNAPQDLLKANNIMRHNIIANLISQGVNVVDPLTTFIDAGARIGKGSMIYPFTVIERGVKIGRGCSVGPFCHLRSGVTIKDAVALGNFVELVRSQIGKNTLIKHFSYLGDAQVGERVNIGAGTVTANFDGKKKSRTQIKDGAFIGSDSVLVAPVKIGKGAITGAGAVVTKNRNVAPNTIVVGVPAKPLKKK